MDTPRRRFSSRLENRVGKNRHIPPSRIIDPDNYFRRGSINRLNNYPRRGFNSRIPNKTEEHRRIPEIPPSNRIETMIEKSRREVKNRINTQAEKSRRISDSRIQTESENSPRRDPIRRLKFSEVFPSRTLNNRINEKIDNDPRRISPSRIKNDAKKSRRFSDNHPPNEAEDSRRLSPSRIWTEVEKNRIENKYEISRQISPSGNLIDAEYSCRNSDSRLNVSDNPTRRNSPSPIPKEPEIFGGIPESSFKSPENETRRKSENRQNISEKSPRRESNSRIDNEEISRRIPNSRLMNETENIRREIDSRLKISKNSPRRTNPSRIEEKIDSPRRISDSRLTNESEHYRRGTENRIPTDSEYLRRKSESRQNVLDNCPRRGANSRIDKKVEGSRRISPDRIPNTTEDSRREKFSRLQNFENSPNRIEIKDEKSRRKSVSRLSILDNPSRRTTQSRIPNTTEHSRREPDTRNPIEPEDSRREPFNRLTNPDNPSRHTTPSRIPNTTENLRRTSPSRTEINDEISRRTPPSRIPTSPESRRLPWPTPCDRQKSERLCLTTARVRESCGGAVLIERDWEVLMPWMLRCVCAKLHQDKDLICCDNCNAWQHIECYYSDPEAIPSAHFCKLCSSEDSTTRPEIIVAKMFDEQSEEENSDNQQKRHSSPVIASDLSRLSYEDDYLKDSLGEAHAECKCNVKIQKFFTDLQLQGIHFEFQSKNKNCQTSNLKNGQKVLKSLKVIPENSFICEMKGEIHIYHECPYIQLNYNSFSSFIYNIEISDKVLVLDTRNSTNFSRYVRRSCTPNSKISFSFDSQGTVKMYMNSLTSIPVDREITVAIDRTEFIINNFRNSTRHHWQKYDYSSCLLCECGSVKKMKVSDSEVATCKIKALKNLIRSLKARIKNSDSKNDNPSSSDSAEDSSADARDDIRSGMSREQKMLDYAIKRIQEMETTGDSHKLYPNKRQRKARQQVDEDFNYKIPSKKPYNKMEKDTSPNFPRMKSAYKKLESNKIPSSNEDIPENTSKNLETDIIYQKTENVITTKYCDDPPSYWINPTLNKILVDNANEIFETGEKIFNSHLKDNKKSTIPLEIALRRGLYHIIPGYYDLNQTNLHDNQDIANANTSSITNSCNINTKIESNHLNESSQIISSANDSNIVDPNIANCGNKNLIPPMLLPTHFFESAEK